MQCGYGLVHPEQAREYAEAVCELLGQGGGNALDMLLDTAAAETQTGRYRDPTPKGAGRGLYQCDYIAFIDVQRRARISDVVKVVEEFGVDIRKAHHAELDVSPLLATVFCRLFYKLIPESFPDTVVKRADYWKRHYNTVMGKGTIEGYLDKVAQYKV